MLVMDRLPDILEGIDIELPRFGSELRGGPARPKNESDERDERRGDKRVPCAHHCSSGSECRIAIGARIDGIRSSIK
jgi:hypothetical protein